MISSITSTTKIEPVVEARSVNQKSTQSKSQPTVTDTVEISSSGETALHEVEETPDHTAKEAYGGDHQAQRLLEKRAAEEQHEGKFLAAFLSVTVKS